MEIASLNEGLRVAKAAGLEGLTGTQMEKTAKLEASLAENLHKIEQKEAEMKYWRSIGKLIENKISLGQSILANITSQVRSGMYFNESK